MSPILTGLSELLEMQGSIKIFIPASVTSSNAEIPKYLIEIKYVSPIFYWSTGYDLSKLMLLLYIYPFAARARNVSYDWETWERMIPYLQQKTVNLKKFISHTLPLQQAVDGFDLASSKKSLKVVFQPTHR